MLNPAILEDKRTRIAVLFSASLIFFLCRWGDIHLPSYWDEMASYVNGILHLYTHGISLHPSAIPAHTSYGHPLFMHNVMAVLMLVFGKGMHVLHTATVVFTLLTAYASYLLCYEISKDRLRSVLCFFIFLIQPIVIAQSTQVLLEMFLCMLTVFSLLFYLREQHIAAVLFACMAVMTKETGLVLAIAFLTHLSIRGLLERKKSVFLSLLLYSLPLLVFAVFLLITKATWGWYLNPVNVGKSKLLLSSMLQKFIDYPLEIVFIDQGRYIFSAIVLAALLSAVRKREAGKSRSGMPVVLLIVYCFGFTVFSCIADTLERYFVVLMPFISMVFAMSCVYFGRFGKAVPLILFFAGAAVNLIYLSSDKRYTEVDLGYRHMVFTNKAAFDFINTPEFRGSRVGFAFPFQFAGSDPGFGYYTEKTFTSDSLFSESCDYRIYTHPGNFDWNAPDSNSYQKLREFHSGYSTSYIFKRKVRD